MKSWKLASLALAMACATVAQPAMAELAVVGEDLFVVRHTVTVTADAEASWQALVNPSDWWSSDHSFSGDAENFTLDARAGGCFCEMLPAGEGRAQPGSVRHLEVVFVDPGKAMRLVGALGPLQSEPVNGVMTVTLKSVEGGTRILFEYVVGGPSRFEQNTIAPAVDGVIGEQLSRLASLLGGSGIAPIPAFEPEPSAPAVEEEATEQAVFGAETRAVPVIAEELPPVEPEPQEEEDQPGIGADFLSR